jgi:hypothetical protein
VVFFEAEPHQVAEDCAPKPSSPISNPEAAFLLGVDPFGQSPYRGPWGVNAGPNLSRPQGRRALLRPHQLPVRAPVAHREQQQALQRTEVCTVNPKSSSVLTAGNRVTFTRADPPRLSRALTSSAGTAARYASYAQLSSRARSARRLATAVARGALGHG